MNCSFKFDIFIYGFVCQFFIWFFDVVIFTKKTTPNVCPFLINIFLSSVSSLKVFYSSFVIFDGIDKEPLRRSSKTSFPRWLKSSCKPGWTLPVRLGRHAGLSENLQEGSSLKFHLMRMLLEKSLKLCLNSGSFIDIWLGAKSDSFSKTWVSIS